MRGFRSARCRGHDRWNVDDANLSIAPPGVVKPCVAAYYPWIWVQGADDRARPKVAGDRVVVVTQTALSAVAQAAQPAARRRKLARLFMHGTPGEDTGPTNTEAGAMVGRVPSRGTLSRIQAQYELSGLARGEHGWASFFTRRADGPSAIRQDGQPAPHYRERIRDTRPTTGRTELSA